MVNPFSIFNLEKSELRKKLLLYFFTNPDREHYVREIAGILRVDPTNLSRELRRLEMEGIFRSETSGHQKYFSLNREFALYQELKSAISKTIGVPAALKNVLGSISGISRAFIFGSYAKGTQNAQSDIDVCLIIKGRGFSEAPLLDGIKKLEAELGREISYVYFTEPEWIQKKKAKDSFVLGIERGKKIELIDERN
jgi:predicted nucleotidyltransferase